MSNMYYINKTFDESLVLEPEDWSESEWITILKIFGLQEAERIVISNHKLEAYGIEKTEVSEDQWDKAIEHLDSLIIMYATIGWPGQFGLHGVLVPLKKRYENGERTKELYDEIMECE